MHATELIRAVEQAGGRLEPDGDSLVNRAGDAVVRRIRVGWP